MITTKVFALVVIFLLNLNLACVQMTSVSSVPIGGLEAIKVGVIGATAAKVAGIKTAVAVVGGKIGAAALAKKAAILGVVGAAKTKVAAVKAVKVAAATAVIGAKSAAIAGTVAKAKGIKKALVAGVVGKVGAVAAAGVAAAGLAKEAVALPIGIAGDVVQAKIDFTNNQLANVGNLIGLRDAPDAKLNDLGGDHAANQYREGAVESGKSLSYLPSFFPGASSSSNDAYKSADAPVQYQFIPDFGFSQYNRVRYAPNIGVDVPIQSSHLSEGDNHH